MHSGTPVRLRLRPAEAGNGIVFVRTDAGGVRIPATLDYVGPSHYATVLRRDEVKISTIEHLMAALYALLVDDRATSSSTVPEVPILDGSSRPFVEAHPRRPACADLDVESRLRESHPAGGDRAPTTSGSPPIRAAEYRVTYAIDFDHPMLGYQELSVSLWGEGDFAEKLAPARTFTFERRGRGAPQGAGPGPGRLAGQRAGARPRIAILNPELRFPDEFVRHKMLDLTGDLSLLGQAAAGPRRGLPGRARPARAQLARRASGTRRTAGTWPHGPGSQHGRLESAAGRREDPIALGGCARSSGGCLPPPHAGTGRAGRPGKARIDELARLPPRLDGAARRCVVPVSNGLPEAEDARTNCRLRVPVTHRHKRVEVSAPVISWCCGRPSTTAARHRDHGRLRLR